MVRGPVGDSCTVTSHPRGRGRGRGGCRVNCQQLSPVDEQLFFNHRTRQTPPTLGRANILDKDKVDTQGEIGDIFIYLFFFVAAVAQDTFEPVPGVEKG